MSAKTELIIATIVVVALIGLLICAGVYEHRQWEDYRLKYNCQKIGTISGDVGIGTGTVIDPSTGQLTPVVVTTISPGKTGWKCSDGMTHWR